MGGGAAIAAGQLHLVCACHAVRHVTSVGPSSAWTALQRGVMGGESESQGAGPLFWACCNCKSQDHYIPSGHPTADVPPLGGWASSPGGKGNVLVAMPNRTLRHIELVRARINFSSTHTHCNFVWPNKSIAYGGRGRYFLRANPNVSVDPANFDTSAISADEREHRAAARCFALLNRRSY